LDKLWVGYRRRRWDDDISFHERRCSLPIISHEKEQTTDGTKGADV